MTVQLAVRYRIQSKSQNDVGHQDKEKEAENHRQHGNQTHQLHRDIKMLSNTRADALHHPALRDTPQFFIQIQSGHYLSLQFGCSASRIASSA
ncbi:hypothetical protein UUU_16620 [Klebsiella pneumoniae subsp. pneumoniae DSM 30104 = JCM 1662 = NBRC 14940]|nr:hypothetical protein UUU_16620 [Klebsiella pneumoniae subsp. pneumoniae DSM 30104 = JCM 1662 = NBRC 14940]